MKRALAVFITLAWVAAFFAGAPARASQQHIWQVPSPNHGQTFAYGSEQNRQWAARGHNNHLAVFLTYTNDPYVDSINPPEYDYFTFNFPDITLGPDGKTFYFHAQGGRALPVAEKHHGFLDITEITLLPTGYLIIKKAHGYLTLTLLIGDHPFERNPNFTVGFDH